MVINIISMNEPTLPKPRRKLTALELSAPARGALRRLKSRFGMSFTHAVERGLALLDTHHQLPEPLTPAERTALGLSPAPRNLNRKRAGGAQ